ncbi:hypothetical protein V8F06_014610 [Rhypophila decipiens]
MTIDYPLIFAKTPILRSKNTATMAPLKILIVGAGISGTSLAYWLSKSKAAHSITVIERFPALRDTGLQLDLRGPGIEVLKRMGLEAAFRSKAVPEEPFQLLDSSGRIWADFRANKSGNGLQSFTSDFEILRGDFCRILYDASLANPNGQVKYVFGTSLESFVELDNDKGVQVTLSSSTSDTNPTTTTTTEIYDLVIGADGQYSHTRKMLLAQAQGLPQTNLSAVQDAIHYTGPSIAYFTIRFPDHHKSSATPSQEWTHPQYISQLYPASNRRFVMTRRHSPSTIQAYLTCFPPPGTKFDSIKRGDIPAEKAFFTETFSNAGWHVNEILRRMNDPGSEGTKDFYCERLGLVQMDKWSSERGHVVVTGDAAHCPTAFTGFGTSSAMVGSYVLAGEIEQACGNFGGRGVPEALKRYEDVFRPFMKDVQRGVRENRVMEWWPRSEFGVGVVRLLAAVFVRMRLEVIGRWVLAEGKVEGWKLPDYEL